MKVCFIINSLAIGGAERFLIEKLLYWQTISEWKFYLILLKDEIEFDQYNKCKIEEKFVLQSSGHLSRIFEIRNIILRAGIDVCISTLEQANKLSSIAAYISRVPCIAVVSSINLYPTQPIARSIAVFIYNYMSSRVVGKSDAVRAFLVHIGVSENKVRVVENGLNFKKLSETYKYTPNTNRIELLFVGRLDPAKGLDLLFKALQDFNRVNNNWYLTLIGDGPLRSKLEQMANELQIREKIEFAGMHKLPWAVKPHATVFCLPSYREGLPNALLEAISIGFPAITSDVSTLTSLVLPESGITFSSGSQDELLSALITFSEFSEEKLESMSKAAQKVALNYDISIAVNKYIDIVNEVVK